MSTLIQSMSPLIYNVSIFTHVGIASVNVLMDNAPAGFAQIVTAVNNVKQGVFDIATALAALMVIVAGMMIMVDREASMDKRGQRLAFLKTVLLGYAVVVGATFLLTLMQQVVGVMK